jgi:hypothetical protein
VAMPIRSFPAATITTTDNCRHGGGVGMLRDPKGEVHSEKTAGLLQPCCKIF